MDIAKSKESESDIKNAIDRAQDLLERLKNRKAKRLIDEKGSADPDQPMSNGNSGKAEDKLNSSFRQRRNVTSATSVNIKPAKSQEELSEEKPPCPNDAGNHIKDEATKLAPQKRKQDKFLTEIHDRAEVISKSARQSADKVVSSIPAASLEEDPEAGEFLKKIRAVPTTEPEENPPQETPTEVENRPAGTTTPDNDEACVDASQEKIKPRSHSAPFLDFSFLPMDVNVLDSAAAKDKMSVGRAGSIKGRRKPTAAARRSLKLSAEDAIVEATPSGASLNVEGQGGVKESESGEFSMEITRTPSEGKTEGLRPRAKPKPKPKSKTVAGIVLPGLADAIQARQRKEQLSSADLVREAAERKRAQVEREDKVDKQPEKPKWLVEAEARRKMHDRRRQVSPLEKPKRSESTENSRVTVSSKPEATQQISPTAEKASARVELVGPVSPNRVGGGVQQVTRRPYRILPAKPEETEGKRGDQNTSESSLASRTPKNSEGQGSGSSSSNVTISTQKSVVSRTRVSRTPRTSESDRIEIASPTSPVSPPRQDGEPAKITSPVVPVPKPKPSSKSIAVTPAAISSVSLRKSGGEVDPGSELPNSPPGRAVTSPQRGPAPRIAPKPTRIESRKASVTSRESGETSTVELRRSSADRTRPRPVSEFIPRSYSTKERRRRDSSEYNPNLTGEMLPQWKLDLMERRKSVTSRADLQSQPAASAAPAVPQWKKELAERRKQREQATGLPSANKENHPKETPEAGQPRWRREIRERKNRRADGTSVRPQSEIIETEAPDWHQKWSSLRRGQTKAVSQTSESPDGAVPSFMREFQLKKRCVVQKDKPVPPTSAASYV